MQKRRLGSDDRKSPIYGAAKDTLLVSRSLIVACSDQDLSLTLLIYHSKGYTQEPSYQICLESQLPNERVAQRWLESI